MARMPRDNNNVVAISGVLNTDGATIKPVYVDPSSHGVQMSDGVAGSDAGSDNATMDDNRMPSLLGVSDDDGVTPVPIFVNSSGEILIQYT